MRNVISVIAVISVLAVVSVLLIAPFFVSAAEPTVPPPPRSGGSFPSLIVCDGPDCNFSSFILFIKNLITALVYTSIPLAAISFAWAGFLLLTSGGSVAKKDEAKGIFKKAALGFIFVLAAWLIVYFITSILLNTRVDPNLILLQPSS